ncbi:orotidine-5'-phosphate decarboxylase [Treponema pectinovorum]|uniref:orotidine-5'-phosphate decarboxylase n=1 Tax=Treponema pectinovorum TaxID=164 RepID=UPI003D937A5E
MNHNMQILQEMATKNGPLCVGLDTDPSYLPEPLLKVFSSPAEAILAYNKEIIKRVASEKSACCFKIQIAYYEAMGLEGLKAYIQTIKAVHEAGFLAISDIKRGDIADTAKAYARAHFSGEFESDIITINPYMGFDTLKPFTEYCKPVESRSTSQIAPQKVGGKGIFVLLRTSNPGMVDIEQQELKSGGRVLDCTGKELQRIAREFDLLYQNQTCSPVGAVVGCTQESDARLLRDAYPNIFFLIPGYGAQGGEAKIAATLLDKAGGTVNSSRGILCAWKKTPELANKVETGNLCLKEIADAAGAACVNAKKDLLAAKKSLGL